MCCYLQCDCLGVKQFLRWDDNIYFVWTSSHNYLQYTPLFWISVSLKVCCTSLLSQVTEVVAMAVVVMVAMKGMAVVVTVGEAMEVVTTVVATGVVATARDSSSWGVWLEVFIGLYSNFRSLSGVFCAAALCLVLQVCLESIMLVN